MNVVGSLTAEELRVLACLIEKSHTTPEHYPLSSNALMTACNQKSSRDPVVEYPVKLVDETLQLLRDAGWVRMIRASGNRTFKHRHVVDEKLGLSVPQQAVLAVLALRGPQSPGELKSRTERYHPFDGPADVERTLRSLADRPDPLVHNVGRRSGQSQDRWVQLLGPVDPSLDLSTRPTAEPDFAERSAAEPGYAEGPVDRNRGPAAATPPPRDQSSPTDQPFAAGPSAVDPAFLVRSESAPVRPAGAAPADGDRASVPRIDCLQCGTWSEPVFRQLNRGGIAGVHVTIAHHESFREMVHNIERWNRWFERYPEFIVHGCSGDDVRSAAAEGRTAVLFGFQNPTPIESDLGLVEICHRLGVRFMQLSHDNQSLLAGGCGEDADAGVTRFGRQVIAEMNRVGIVIDLSRSAERSTLDAIALSERPIAITNANPTWWHPTRRSKSNDVLEALTASGGMIGFSAHPDDLAGGSACTLESFCEMVAEAASRYGVHNLGIGSGLGRNQPDSAADPGFSPPSWLPTGAEFENVADGLAAIGFLSDEVDAVMGGNWLRFFDHSLGPVSRPRPAVAV